ncbi:hypothetical protein [Halovivax sp.]|uniref:hypothetical protein n=1 Tax=Halovivax sp. TaxID=1935978 RepID=UPI0025C715A0|nr:hypothetical protein [Halovivax sp.]
MGDEGPLASYAKPVGKLGFAFAFVLLLGFAFAILLLLTAVTGPVQSGVDGRAPPYVLSAPSEGVVNGWLVGIERPVSLGGPPSQGLASHRNSRTSEYHMSW